MTSWAAFPKADKAQELKRKTHMLPKRPPRKTSGIVISMLVNLDSLMKLTSSMKALKRRKQAREAVPTE